MRILLIGEYSRLHNSLKEGLTALGHDVLLVGTCDGFKNFPVDINYSARIFNKRPFKWMATLIHKITSINLRETEHYIKFKKILPKLNNYDVVQLINERSIKTSPKLEIKLIKALHSQNKRLFLLSCGTDYISVNYAFQKKLKYSILTPLHEDIALKKHYQFVLHYLKPSYKNLHQFLYNLVDGVIASDLDYHLPLKENSKYLGLIPNPINTDKITFSPLDNKNKVVIFHGINKSNYIKKGNSFFVQALDIITAKYGNKIQIITTENLPYDAYINALNSCHILLDQVYAYDQGYNALEAMAKGKVVFTGAEKAWLEHYNLKENTIAINAIPEVGDLVSKLEWLINNPKEIASISINARAFIEKHHNHINVAQQYLNTWLG